MMQVKLKVLVGKSAGKEIPVPVSRFLIGRAEDCHMRPKSDAISRNHCAILVSEEKVAIRDLNSRNGTMVNGERITSERELETGDRIRIGKLEFEVLIKEAKRAKKEETKQPAKEKEARADAAPQKATKSPAKSDSSSIDFDVSEWLEEADAVAKARSQSEPETRQFQLDETDRVELAAAADLGSPSPQDTPQDKSGKLPKPAKKPPGKLPQRPAVQAATSKEAAAEMLKKFFSNR